MKLHIAMSNHDIQLEGYVRKHITSAIGRFSKRIAVVHVRVVELHDGAEVRCSIQAKLKPRGSLHVEARESDVLAAVNEAKHRLRVGISRRVARGHRSKMIRHKGKPVVAVD